MHPPHQPWMADEPKSPQLSRIILDFGILILFLSLADRMESIKLVVVVPKGISVTLSKCFFTFSIRARTRTRPPLAPPL